MSDWWCYWCKDAFVPIYATPCSKCVDGNGFTPLYATPCGKRVDGGKFVHKGCETDDRKGTEGMVRTNERTD